MRSVDPSLLLPPPPLTPRSIDLGWGLLGGGGNGLGHGIIVRRVGTQTTRDERIMAAHHTPPIRRRRPPTSQRAIGRLRGIRNQDGRQKEGCCQEDDDIDFLRGYKKKKKSTSVSAVDEVRDAEEPAEEEEEQRGEVRQPLGRRTARPSISASLR